MNKDDLEALLSIGRLEVLLRENDRAMVELEKLEKMVQEKKEKRIISTAVEKLVELDQSQTLSGLAKANIEFLRNYAVGNSDVEAFNRLMAKDLAWLNISVRAYNALKKAGVETVEDLIAIPMEFFNKGKDFKGVKINGLGRKSREEVLAALSEMGLAPCGVTFKG
jgi:DNA-directed RNA polymerase alpha subunit